MNGVRIAYYITNPQPVKTKASAENGGLDRLSSLLFQAFKQTPIALDHLKSYLPKYF